MVLNNLKHNVETAKRIIGRITMDMTMMDVTDVPGVKIGDEVVILGSQGSESISAKDLAGWAGTSPYEIFCDINPRVPEFTFHNLCKS
jgi:alanine racemase